MKVFPTLSLFLSLAIALNGCKKDEIPSKPVVIINPQQVNVFNEVGNIQGFSVEVSSEEAVSKFRISQQTVSEGTVILVDTAIGGTNFNYNLEFKITPEYSGQTVHFTFEAIDKNGVSGKAARKLIVDHYSYALVETSGHKMYSANSSDFFAYDLEVGTSRGSQESWTLKDITENDIAKDSLSPRYTWRSPNGARFVKHNGFDYANATNQSVQDAFDSGASSYTIEDLAPGDIIIVKTADNYLSCCPYIVVKIDNIVDNSGVGDDYYLFSIKK